MSVFPVEVGRVVYAKAGRDAGRYFIVLETLEGPYVAIADGITRKIERPKKKKLMHLEPKMACFPSILEKLQSGHLLDADVRACLSDAGYVRKEG